MPTFTKEQQEAIDREGENILVSAGAGSGKTAVLTERVLRKVKQGVAINQLLILTFTNKAALEMKERIRKKLQKEHLQDQLELLDSSYITTFDAFSLSVVKKYADILHISKEVKIAEDSILKLKKQMILEEIMMEYYEQPTPAFEALISYFCLKDDKQLQEKILALDEKLELELDKESILKNYVSTYYQEENLHKIVAEYIELVFSKKKELEEYWFEFSSMLEGKYLEKVTMEIAPLLESNDYISIRTHTNFSIPRLPNQSSEEIKASKQKVVEALKQLQELTIYETEETMKQAIMKTKSTIEIMLEMIAKLHTRFQKFKIDHQFYTFMDIEKLAITLVRDYEEVRNELKNSFQEILIDEYQDTNDIQETFISYIANNNVYMVGDIKQSIYRFRNANPMIFKEKYDKYKQHIDGSVIDLNKNFRSRREVIDDINLLFGCIMDNEIGGAAYQEGHAMIFGNTTYEGKATTEDNHKLELISYDCEDEESSKLEKEAFLIAADIKDKIANGYLVYDKDADILRPIEYRDFVILLDRSTDFTVYRQIFEYLEIPLTLWQDEKASSGSDLYLLKNMFVITSKLAIHQLDTEFIFSFVSLARSFLFQMSDEEIYHCVQEKDFENSPIYQTFYPLAQIYQEISPTMFLDEVLTSIHYHEKLIQIGNIKVMTSRMEYFYNLIKQLESSGYTIDDITNYLQTITATNFEIKLAMSKPETNSVKIMTIHTSKGLEYPICYFAGFIKKFNDSDFKETVLYDKVYGIVIPDFENNQNLISKTLMLHHLKIADIGEKIRLFYVALTRAREKIIIVMPKEEENVYFENKVDDLTRLKYTSFEAIMKSVYSNFFDRIKEIKVIPSFSKDYLKVKDIQKIKRALTQIETIPSVYQVGKQEMKTFSKTSTDSFTKKELLSFGSKVHTILERCDFIHGTMPKIDDPFLYQKIHSFLQSDFIKQHCQDQIYQEYEFYYVSDHKKTHGKIDLLIVNEQEAIIVDYKLKYTIDEAYQLQLMGYKNVISDKLSLPVSCYLYSILDEKFTEIKC